MELSAYSEEWAQTLENINLIPSEYNKINTTNIFNRLHDFCLGKKPNLGIMMEFALSLAGDEGISIYDYRNIFRRRLNRLTPIMDGLPTHAFCIVKFRHEASDDKKIKFIESLRRQPYMAYAALALSGLTQRRSVIGTRVKEYNPKDGVVFGTYKIPRHLNRYLEENYKRCIEFGLGPDDHFFSIEKDGKIIATDVYDVGGKLKVAGRVTGLSFSRLKRNTGKFYFTRNGNQLRYL